MSSARTFFFIEAAFLAGVGVGGTTTAAVAVVTIAAVVVAKLRSRSWRCAIVCGAAMLAGAFRWQQSAHWRESDGAVSFQTRPVVVSGVIADEPDRRVDGERVTLAVRMAEENGRAAAVRGRVLLSGPLYPALRYGETVTVRCRLARPEPIEDFAYDEYLALSRVYSTCRRPIILGRAPPRFSLRGVLFSLKWRCLDRLATSIPEPQAALLGGILLGARSGLPDGVTESFREAGLSHLIALSGYNITILISAVLGATVRLGGSRRQAFWISTAVLAAFVVMTGAAASVVRAAVMGFLVVLARQLGRASRIRYALAFSATVMVGLNPRILLFDAGFHLSFLATVGLVVFAGPFQQRLTALPKRWGIRESVATTLAATLATLPLIAVQFDRVSLIGPLANLLVLPLMPVVMLLGGVALVPVVSAAALPFLWGLLTWILLVAETAAAVPWSSLAIPPLPAWAVMVWYGGAVCLYWLWKHLSANQRQRSAAAPDALH